MKTTKQSQQIHIGIIGGMGPQASALLHTKLVEACTRDLHIRDCHQFPLITHVSIPAIDFISQPELRSQNSQLLRNAIEAIQTTPVDVVVIACNTAHLLIDELPELANLPLVTLPNSVVARASDKQARTLGLIASPTTIRMKLYDDVIKGAGMELLTPNERDLKRAERIIRATIAGNAGTAEVVELRRIANTLLARGADQVILGCTELSVVMDKAKDSKLIDSLTATTDQVISLMRIREQELTHV